MWFGIVFAILVEIVPLKMRSTTVGVFLFVMNNIGGNLPILVDPVGKALGYRESISIFYAGFYGISKSFRVVSSFSIFTIPPPTKQGSILFAITIFFMETKAEPKAPITATQQPQLRDRGHDNRVFADENNIAPNRLRDFENSKL